MGYMSHHAILVTSWNSELLEKAYKRASELFTGFMLSPTSGPVTNNYRSFAVFPDGSKERWEESDKCDTSRTLLKGYLNSLAYDDGSSSIDWVEVQYGDDCHETKVIDSSDDFCKQNS